MKKWKAYECQFSCAHFYNQPDWTPDRNKQVFGKCYSKYGHGHDYRLQVDFELGSMPAAKLLEDSIIDLKEHLDHRHLNFDLPEFSTLNPTSENILWFCREHLRKRLGSEVQMRLTLWESNNLAVQEI